MHRPPLPARAVALLTPAAFVPGVAFAGRPPRAPVLEEAPE